MLPKSSAIYCILNTITRKRYYGSAKNIRNRWSQHLSDLKNNIHDNIHLQNSYNVYGKNAFILEIVCFCSIENLIKFEQKCLDKYETWNKKSPNFGYNIAKSATSPMLGRNHSQITIEIMKIKGKNKAPMKESSKKQMAETKKEQYKTGEQVPYMKNKRHKLETIEKISQTKRKNFASGQTIPFMKDKKHKPESIEKMSKIKTGKKYSQATIDKRLETIKQNNNGSLISLKQLENLQYWAKNQKRKPIKGINEETGEIIKFIGINEVKKIGYNTGAIMRCLTKLSKKGKKLKYKGYFWEYLDINEINKDNK